MDDAQFKKLMEEARRANVRMDEEDRAAGFAAPVDCSPELQLRTAKAAIECGIRTEDWAAVAEGLDLLRQLKL